MAEPGSSSSIVGETAASKEEKEEGNKLDDPAPAAAAEAMVTERVPDSFIHRIRINPNLRPRPITEDFILRKPELLKKFETHHYNMNKCVDLQDNVLRQADARGYAEVVVKYTDGVKKIYPLPGY